MTKKSTESASTMTLHIAPEKVNGKYCNMVSLTIGKNEVVFDFAFLMPSSKGENTSAEVVERVIMSPQVAKDFLSAFQNAVLDFEKNIKKG